MRTADPLAAIRRRLEKWELQHLRQHALELQERLDRAEEEAARGWASAEFWRDNALELQQALIEYGSTVGITKAGQMVAAKPEEATTP